MFVGGGIIMKQYLFILLISLLVFSSCSSDTYTFNEGTLIESDSLATITFEPVEVQEGLFLTEKAVVDKETNQLTIELSFDSTSFEGAYEYIAYVPKELAKDVSDIAFSVVPDNIIDPDPIFSWWIEMEASTAQTISYILGEKSGITATDEKIITAVQALEYLSYHNKIKQCASRGDANYYCYVQLITEYKDLFLEKDCIGLGSKAEVEACKSFVNDDPTHCEYNGGADCPKYYFDLEITKCKLSDEDCMADAAMKTRHLQACDNSFIKDEGLRAICKTTITQDDNHCTSLLHKNRKGGKDVDTHGACCMALIDEAQQARCIASGEDAVADSAKTNKDNFDSTQTYDYYFMFENPEAGCEQINLGYEITTASYVTRKLLMCEFELAGDEYGFVRLSIHPFRSGDAALTSWERFGNPDNPSQLRIETINVQDETFNAHKIEETYKNVKISASGTMNMEVSALVDMAKDYVDSILPAYELHD
jgi:hypothetical protein